LCAALLTYPTPSCKPITLKRVLDSDCSKQISTNWCHLTHLVSLTSFTKCNNVITVILLDGYCCCITLRISKYIDCLNVDEILPKNLPTISIK
jgi:hypothetical protein